MALQGGLTGGLSLGRLFFELAIIDRGQFKGAVMTAQAEIDKLNAGLGRNVVATEGVAKSQSDLERQLVVTNKQLALAEAHYADLSKRMRAAQADSNAKLGLNINKLTLDLEAANIQLAKLQARFLALSEARQLGPGGQLLGISMQKQMLEINAIESKLIELKALQSAPIVIPAASAVRLGQAEAEMLRLKALQTELTAGVASFGVTSVGSVGKFGGAIMLAGWQMEKFSVQLQRFAKDFTIQWSLASAVIAGLIEKTAIEFDTQMGEIRRTTQMTRAEVNLLGADLLALSKNMPTKDAAVTLGQIAAVAGQAGIKGREEIKGFSEAVLMLTAVFDGLEAKDTALKMVQMAHAFGEPVSQVARYGSVISRVANESAATAEQIINFTQAVAGTAQNLGISFDKVVALGGALIDLGVPANQAGTALTNFFTKIVTEPEKFASQMGISTAKFRQMVEKDAVGAILQWLRAWGGMSKSGEEGKKISFEFGEALSELGIRGAKADNILMKLRSQGIEPFVRMMALSSDELRKGTSLTDQFAIKQEQMAGQMSAVANKGKALAITMGTDLFPVLKALLGVFEGFISVFSAFGPVKDFVLALLMITAISGPLALVFGNLGRFVATFIVSIGQAIEAARLFEIAQIEMGYASVSMGAKVSAGISAISTGNLIIAGAVLALTLIATAMTFYSQKSYEAKAAQDALDSSIKATIDSRVSEQTKIAQSVEAMKPLIENQKRTAQQQGELNTIIADLDRLAPGFIDKNKLYGDSLQYVADKAIIAKKALKEATDEADMFNRQNRLTALDENIEKNQQKLRDKVDAMAQAIKNARNLTTGSTEQAVWHERVAAGIGSTEPIGQFIETGNLDLAIELSQKVYSKYLLRKRELEKKVIAGTATGEERDIIEAFRKDMDFFSKLGEMMTAHAADWAEKNRLTSNLLDSGAVVNSGGGGGKAGTGIDDLKNALSVFVEREAVLKNFIETEEFKIKDNKGLTKEGKGAALSALYKDVNEKIIARNAQRDGLKKQLGDLVSREYDGANSLEALRVSVIAGGKGNLTKFDSAALSLLTSLESGKMSLKTTGASTKDGVASRMEELRERLNMEQGFLDLMTTQYKYKKDQAKDSGMLQTFLMGDGVTLKANVEAVRAMVIQSIRDMTDDLVANAPEAKEAWAAISGTLDSDSFGRFSDAALKKGNLTTEQKKQLLEIMNALKAVEGTMVNDDARKSDKDPFILYAESVEKMGVKAGNVLAIMQNGMHNFSRSVAAMAFDTRVTLASVWQGMAQDFIAMFVDEAMKKFFASRIASLVATMFGGPVAGAVVSYGTSGIAPEEDFILRKNGGVTSFSADDNIIGFKHVSDLFTSLLPSIASPQFATMPNYNVNVPAPQVRVSNQPPNVDVHLYNTLEGQTFMRKEEPKFTRSSSRRKF